MMCLISSGLKSRSSSALSLRKIMAVNNISFDSVGEQSDGRAYQPRYSQRLFGIQPGVLLS